MRGSFSKLKLRACWRLSIKEHLSRAQTGEKTQVDDKMYSLDYSSSNSMCQAFTNGRAAEAQQNTNAKWQRP